MRASARISGRTGPKPTARKNRAFGMIDIQEVMNELATRDFEGRLPPILAQGTERPTRTRAVAFTVASAPIGSGNSTS
jgi:hypothetical protein